MKKTFILLMMLAMILSQTAFAATPKAKTIESSNLVTLSIVLKQNSSFEKLKEALTSKGVQILSDVPEIGVLQVRGPASILPELLQNRQIDSVSPALIHSLGDSNTIVYDDAVHKSEIIDPGEEDPEEPPSDEIFPEHYYYYQWDIKDVTNNGKSFEFEKGNHDVVVGIIDSGVDTDHPDLVNNFLGGKNYVPAGGVEGTDATETGDPNDVQDRNGHGTHVAGTIAGKGLILGVAPEVGFKAYRVFGEDGGATTATVAAAMIGAVNDGVDILSMSLGGFNLVGKVTYTDPTTGETTTYNEIADLLLYKRAVQYAIDHGVTVVVAAGNDSLNVTNKSNVTKFLNEEYGELGFTFSGAGFEAPGTTPGVITVSATGQDEVFASYSNYGPGFVDITAPGGGTDYLDRPVGYTDLAFSSYLGGYAWMAGTSMATPKVSAVAALYIAKYGKMAPNKVAKMIYDGAVDVGKTSKDSKFGNGMVQAPYIPEQHEGVDWYNNFGGIARDRATDVVQTKDGGYITVGFSETYQTGSSEEHDKDYDMFIVKTTQNGKGEWTKAIGNTDDDMANAVIPAKDGGYLITGNYGNEIYLAKLSEVGELIWEHTYPAEGESTANALVETTDGGYIIVGETYSYSLLNQNARIVKVDGNGVLEWDKQFGGPYNDEANSVRVTNDGGYVIVGYSYTYDSYNNKADYYVVKLSKNGELEWEKMFGNEGTYETLNDIQVTDNGEFIVVGETEKRRPLGFGYESQTDLYYARLNQNGEIVWEQKIGEAATNESASSLLNVGHNQFVLTGHSGQPNSFARINDIYTMKFNGEGQIIQEHTFGGEEDEHATAIIATNNGYIVAGNTESFTAGYLDQDMLLVKVNMD